MSTSRGLYTAPSWLGWLALLLEVALFIPFADFIALIVTLLWIIVVSVMLYMAADRRHADTAHLGNANAG